MEHSLTLSQSCKYLLPYYPLKLGTYIGSTYIPTRAMDLRCNIESRTINHTLRGKEGPRNYQNCPMCYSC